MIFTFGIVIVVMLCVISGQLEDLAGNAEDEHDMHPTLGVWALSTWGERIQMIFGLTFMAVIVLLIIAALVIL